MDVTPTALHSAINHDDPGRANLAQNDPSYYPTTHGRATRSSNACRSDRKDVNLPDTCNTYPKSRG